MSCLIGVSLVRLGADHTGSQAEASPKSHRMEVGGAGKTNSVT